jgi:hypothetical protein
MQGELRGLRQKLRINFRRNRIRLAKYVRSTFVGGGETYCTN